MILHDMTIVIGSVASRRTRDTAAIAPAAIAVFRGMLDRHGRSFRVPLPVPGLGHVELQWTSESPGAAVATFWSRGAPVTTSALASGRDPAADRAVLEALQSLVLRFHGDSPFEPGFDLLAIAERPLLATLPIPAPPSPDMGIIADAETCLAAAYFLMREGGA